MSGDSRIFSDKGTCAYKIFKSAHYSKNYDRNAVFGGQRLDQLSEKIPKTEVYMYVFNRPSAHRDQISSELIIGNWFWPLQNIFEFKILSKG